jgi:hypothetical protein
MSSLFKYLKVDRDFQLHIDITSLCDFPKSALYPLSILVKAINRLAERSGRKSTFLADSEPLAGWEPPPYRRPGTRYGYRCRLKKLEDDPAIRENRALSRPRFLSFRNDRMLSCRRFETHQASDLSKACARREINKAMNRVKNSPQICLS